MMPAALSLTAILFQSPPETLVPRDRLKPLELVANQLARGGREAETHELLDVLQALGLPKTSAEPLRQSCVKELAKVKKPLAALPDAAKTIRSTAKTLAALLPAVSDEQRPQLAELVLRLDHQNAEAHAVLDHDLVDGRWQLAGEQKRKERRIAIQGYLQAARTLPVPMTVAESQHPVLKALYPDQPCQVVTWKDIRLHTCFSAEKAQRILRESLRAVAVSSAIRGDGLTLPEKQSDTWLLLDTKPKFLEAMDVLLKAGRVPEKDVPNLKQLVTIHLDQDEHVLASEVEAEAEAFLVYYFLAGLEQSTQACLFAGHLNWVCLAYLGQRAPNISWTEIKEGGGSGQTVSAQAKAEREEFFRLAKAGLFGCRSWMRWLAGRREDPPFTASMVDVMGSITGNDLLKSTVVVELLQEEGLLVDLAKQTRPPSPWSPNQAPRFEAALGQSMAQFEERWRRWILGPGESLADRIDKAQLKAVSPADKETLDYLLGLRKAAFSGPAASVTPLPPVTFEESLSRGCRAHALYLEQNPTQLTAWPDAHEEYADKAGFSPEGVWAGNRSVIMPAADSGKQAIDGWMATFYHRLPLLHPGVLRIGWALEKKIAVLDAVSLCDPARTEWSVAWPPHGMSGVPTRFTPELPNPVPDQDQGTFGYPVTLQLGPRMNNVPIEARLILLEGGLRGKEVPCWVSAPSLPSNPRLAPRDAFCLIPKAPLKPGTTYGVRAEILGPGGKLLEWTFRT